MNEGINWDMGIGPVFGRVAVNYPCWDSFDFGRGENAALCEDLVIIPEEVHEAYGWHLAEKSGMATGNVQPITTVNSFIWFLESLITGVVMADFRRSYTVWQHLIHCQNESGYGLVLSFEPPYSNGRAIPRAVYDQLKGEFALGERGAGYFRESATPLVQWLPPNTVISLWRDDFVVPDFASITLGSTLLVEPALEVANWSDQTMISKGKAFNICYRHYDLVQEG